MTGKTKSADRYKTAIMYAYVATGAVLGGLARYLASLLILPVSGFPLATLFVNVTGSFIIGFYGTLSGPDGRLFATAEQRQFVMTGFCGGYTTFSSFSLEMMLLIERGQPGQAVTYAAVSLLAGLAALYVGLIAMRLAA